MMTLLKSSLVVLAVNESNEESSFIAITPRSTPVAPAK